MDGSIPSVQIPISFSDFFDVSEEQVDAYGAFNVSMVSDLPLFIDPFLLFHSENAEYRALHDQIVRYVTFLRVHAHLAEKNIGLLKEWYFFPEVRQNWFGYSKVGNGGHGLGKKFADSINSNFRTVLRDFGSDPAKSEHFEKIGLFKTGVGRDAVSDLVTNLLHGYLASYTESFAKAHVDSKLLRRFTIRKAEFDYSTSLWRHRTYLLPAYQGDYVLLTPKDMLTKDETWINFHALRDRFRYIVDSLPNDQTRERINHFLRGVIPANPKAVEVTAGYQKALFEFPEIADYFASEREESGRGAVTASSEKVREAQQLYMQRAKKLATSVNEQTGFYQIEPNSLDAARNRVAFLKQVIENQDGYRIFYVKGRPIKREADLQILFKLTWFATFYDVNSEVNNGRGPVDFKVSLGNRDASLVEFKLASNSALKKNLQNQVAIYEKANQTSKSLKVVLYFSASELAATNRTLKSLGLEKSESIVLIDARQDNKPSASTATS
ncbi:MAG: hypothetical protein ACREXR_04860 [Gammaproteobacteria bacterium]